MRLFLPAAVAVALTLAAAISFARAVEAVAGELAVTAWTRATPPRAEVGVAYARVENRGQTEDRLLGASSPIARSVSLHETAEADGVATMRPLDGIAIPAGGTLAMRPGGLHLMLEGLSGPLKQGDTVPLTLTFRDAGEVVLESPVAAMGASEAPAAHAGHGM